MSTADMKDVSVTFQKRDDDRVVHMQRRDVAGGQTGRWGATAEMYHDHFYEFKTWPRPKKRKKVQWEDLGGEAAKSTFSPWAWTGAVGSLNIVYNQITELYDCNHSKY